MKKSIATILTPALVMATVIIAGCGQASTTPSATAPPRAIPQYVPTDVVPLAWLAPRGDKSTTDAARLDEMYDRVQMVIAGYIAAGQPAPEHLDYLYSAAQSVEDAREALEQLEEQRLATQMFVNEYVMGGQPVPDFEYAILESIEQARLTLLRGIGLVD
jgi:hypothetical protein